MTVKLAPSILAADFSRLGSQVMEAIKAGVEYIHIDVMDGQFVPNITIGPLIVEALRPLVEDTNVVLDVHLMIEQPENMIPLFAKAGAGIITVHVETCPHLHRIIQQIKELGCNAGVALNPSTSLASIENILGDIDMALVMSVNPGFGGQSFISFSLDKITSLRELLDDRGLQDVDLEVDGGVKFHNAYEIVAAGANILVAGSAIFNDKATIAENIQTFHTAISPA